MEGALTTTRQSAPRRRVRRGIPWGLLAGIELIALAAVSAWLVLVLIPSAFEVEWSCFGESARHTSADTYIGAFAVGGVLGWLVAAGLTALVHTSSRGWLAVVVPAAWFGVLVIASVAVAASIGPLSC